MSSSVDRPEKGIHPIIVGTAGHVDHGKSSLVRAVTGVDPDRWQEEKERGLTIDLGFAPLTFSDGVQVGLIDVPGHERFLKNMVAGATSIDLAILVVAADDGVMPQTREHLDILELLGVEKGVVALTKIDLVDEETLLLAREDIRDLCEGRFLEGAEILPVSSQTGEGLEEFCSTLERLAREARPRSSEGLFRMPVQRCFTIRGFGTVLTGIPLAGEIEVGAQVLVVGKGLSSRIRGIHAYGRKVDRATAGHSTALNLPGIPLEKVQRGDVVAAEGDHEPTRRIEAEIRVVEEAGTLRHGEGVHVHLGTREEAGSVFLLDRPSLAPGETGLAQIQIQREVAALPGDYLLLRRLSPARTLAGGRILGIGGRRLRRFREEVLARLQAKEQSLDTPEERLKITLAEAGEEGLSFPSCHSRLGWTAGELEAVLQSLLDGGGAFRDPRSGRIFGRGSVEREQERIERMLGGWFRKHPLSVTCPVSRFRTEGKGGELLPLTLNKLEAEGRIRNLPGGRIRDLARKDPMGPEQREKLEKIRVWLEEAGSRARTREELDSTFGAEGGVLLERLLEEGGAVAVGPSFLWGGERYQEAVLLVEELCRGSGGVLDIPSLRDRLQTSRKFLIPFLEHLDRVGVTARKGDRRILRRQ